MGKLTKLSAPQYLHLVIISISSVCLQALFQRWKLSAQCLAHSRCLVKIAILPPNLLFIYYEEGLWLSFDFQIGYVKKKKEGVKKNFPRSFLPGDSSRAWGPYPFLQHPPPCNLCLVSCLPMKEGCWNPCEPCLYLSDAPLHGHVCCLPVCCQPLQETSSHLHFADEVTEEWFSCSLLPDDFHHPPY